MKTVTFNVEDALISHESFAMLSGAGVIKGCNSAGIPVHKVYGSCTINSTTGAIEGMDLGTDTLLTGDDYKPYVTVLNSKGGVIKYLSSSEASYNSTSKAIELSTEAKTTYGGNAARVDCYVQANAAVKQYEVEADSFAGYYYIEAETLFRDEENGKDYPAIFIIPKGKIQTNFTFNMAATGDPSEQIKRMAA